MLLNVILLSLSSSIDSFGIGITYGIRKLTVSKTSKIILFIVSITITYISVLIGENLNIIFSPFITKLLGCFILISMGFFIILQIVTSKNLETNDYKFLRKKTKCYKTKIYKFLIKSLGITIQIIKNPLYSDFDSSQKIDTKEALYLGITLSIDAFCIGIVNSILGFGYILFPILVASFQLIFLYIGMKISAKLSKNSKIPNNIWNLVSGIILILIGLAKLF